MYDLREKKRPLCIQDKQPYVLVRNVASRDLRMFLDDSLVGSSIKDDSVIHWCIGVVFRSCQKSFLSRRKHVTLNQLELYQELRSSHIQKFYELNWFLSECYHPGEQVEMIEGWPLKKPFDVNQVCKSFA